MPSTLGRNLNLCFTKIRQPPILSPTPDDDHSRPLPITITAIPSTSSTSMVKNFNSLYDDDQYMFDSTTTSKSCNLSAASSSIISTYDSDTDEAPADFATAFASQRFFFSSPGRSNSIVDQSSFAATSSSTPTSEPPERTLFGNHSVAVPTYSPDPYRDFRRSMQEMVEARERIPDEEDIKKKSNWEFLHELLLCYLALNPKSTHKFIIGAFADLLVSLMPSPGGGQGGLREPDFTDGVCEISRCG